MKYVGIKSQIRKNNINSVIMLIAFPVLLVAMVYVFVWFTSPDEYRGWPQIPRPGSCLWF